MAIQITAVEAPTVEREPNEFDALVPQVKELADKGGQWAQVTVTADDAEELAKEVESFKRKFGNAATAAGYSRRFAADVVSKDGKSATLKFTIRDKITRERKPKDGEGDAVAPTADAAAE